MKRFFTLLLSASIVFAAEAQPVIIEDFSYTTGDPLTSNGWTQIGTVATNPISVTTPGLTYTGYAGSGIGNAASLTTSGQDLYQDASASISSGAVYASFMLNVSAAQTNGDYFFALLPTTSTSNFTARTFVKSSGTGYVIGVSKSTETPAYGTTELAFNTTYLVVVKYAFVTGTTNDDEISVYVFSSGVPATEPLTTYAGPTTGTVTDAASLGRIGLRQGSASNSATLTIDGIRMGDSWDEGPLPVQLVSFGATLAGNKVNVDWTAANEVNLQSYDIERSVNGKDFMPVAMIHAEGAVSAKNYSFVDQNAVPGVSYYRLKMNDKDGSYKLSQVVMVKNSAVGVSIYPNPVRAALTVQHESTATGATITIVSMSGKQMFSVNAAAGTAQTTIDASKLAPGAYMVIFNNNGTRTSKQFIKE